MALLIIHKENYAKQYLILYGKNRFPVLPFFVTYGIDFISNKELTYFELIKVAFHQEHILFLIRIQKIFMDLRMDKLFFVLYGTKNFP